MGSDPGDGHGVQGGVDPAVSSAVRSYRGCLMRLVDL